MYPKSIFWELFKFRTSLPANEASLPIKEIWNIACYFKFLCICVCIFFLSYWQNEESYEALFSGCVLFVSDFCVKVPFLFQSFNFNSSQMTVPLYGMALKCSKCGVISSAEVSATVTSNAMLVPVISILDFNSVYWRTYQQLIVSLLSTLHAWVVCVLN